MVTAANEDGIYGQELLLFSWCLLSSSYCSGVEDELAIDQNLLTLLRLALSKLFDNKEWNV